MSDTLKKALSWFLKAVLRVKPGPKVDPVE